MLFSFLQQTDLRTLTFFLPGWGMDVRPFRDYRSTETDILMAYDYSDLEMDAKWFSGYERIRIVAWSMGVWAASVLMARHPWLGDEVIAVNGTPLPIDAECGIPPKVFNATLAGLSEDSLARFDRRMCADWACFNAYNRCHPERGLADLSHELACIGREVPLQPVDPRFTFAYAGSRDAIFPFPASPHFAARLAGQSVDCSALTRATQELAARHDVVLVEGAGGLMVPLTETVLTIDYTRDCGYPVVLVTSGRLGSINHTLLSLEALKIRGMRLHALVYNAFPLGDATIRRDTKAYFQNVLAREWPDAALVLLPFMTGDLARRLRADV